MQEKQDQKVILVSLSIHINLEHEEHTQKIKTRLTYTNNRTIQYCPSINRTIHYDLSQSNILYIYMIFLSHLSV